mmetsp:Transcript_2/g.8  ORF Transcript_2/g.8 Transcript_2/m.8 type:complete len:208 (+) Transcript_2:40-663(+)
MAARPGLRTLLLACATAPCASLRRAPVPPPSFRPTHLSRRHATLLPAAAVLATRPGPVPAEDRKLGPIYIRMAGPRELAGVFATLEAELGGESLAILRSVLSQSRWEEASKMARLYDTFLRKDVLVPLADRLPEDRQGRARGIAEEVLATMKGIDRAARRQDAEGALVLCDRLESEIQAYVDLSPYRQREAMRAAEAAKLRVKTGEE